MTQDYCKGETTKRYGVPLTHLDYGYVKSCNDAKELEKIIKILRSGDEGYYPDLEKEAVNRLEHLNPKSRVLRTDNPAPLLRDLDATEREDLSQDLEAWQSRMAEQERSTGVDAVFNSSATSGVAMEEEEEEGGLPPVRSTKVISTDGKVKDENAGATKPKKKPLPRSYTDWDKVDIDKELEKVDEQPSSQKKTAPAKFNPDRLVERINTEGMTEVEKKNKAIQEKDKGNEAFRANDFEESILYYSRSISVSPLAATYNNRALAFLRLSKWDEVICDCNSVLNLEPQNVKALLRRGTALKGKKKYSAACKDLNTVLSLEANNKTAENLLKEIEGKKAKEAEERQKKGRRMVIEEVGGSDDEQDQADSDVVEEIVVDKPDLHPANAAPLVNGHAEENIPPPCEEKTKPNKTEKLSEDTNVVDSRGAGDADTVKSDSALHQTEQEEVKPTASPFSDHSSSCKDSHQPQSHVAESITSEHQPKAKEEEEAAGKETPKSDARSPPTEVTNQQLDSKPKQPPHSQTADHSRSSKTVIESGVCEDAPKDVSGPSQKEEDEVTNHPPASVDEEAPNKEAAAGCGLVCGSDDAGAAVEPAPSRPVYTLAALGASEAALKEEGNRLFREGQYPEAVKSYTRLVHTLEGAAEHVYNVSLVFSNRAACHMKMGDCQSAIADCETALRLVPHSTKPLLRRAAAYEMLEKYRRAYVDYKHVLSVDSSVAQAHQGATRCQRHLQDIDGHRWRDKLPDLARVSYYDIPLIVDPTKAPGSAAVPNASWSQSSGSATIPKKQDAEAAPVAEKESAKEREKSGEEVFEQTKAQGNKHVQKGEYEAAAGCYCRCLALFSDRAAVYTNRALCYLKLNKAAAAEEDCSKALSLDPSNAKAFYRRALARKAVSHYKDSLQDLLQLLRLEPLNTAAKKEMDLVKALYKKEFDQLKSRPAGGKEKKSGEAEKQRKRMKIEEVEEEEEEEGQEQRSNSAAKSKSTGDKMQKSNAKATQPGSPPKAPHTSSSSPHHAPHPTSDKQNTARKPGRAKSKKGEIKETSFGLPTATPSAPKLQGQISAYDFLQHWNSLKQAKEIQPYVQLLEQIHPSHLPAVISNKLDGHMLQIITRCAAHDAHTGEVERAYSILRNIRQVPRFSTVVMFLSSKEKQDIRKVLESASSLGTCSAEELASVRKDFGLK